MGFHNQLQYSIFSFWLTYFFIYCSFPSIILLFSIQLSFSYVTIFFLFYSILVYSVPFCSILLYSVLFYSTQFYSLLPCSMLSFNFLFSPIIFLFSVTSLISLIYSSTVYYILNFQVIVFLSNEYKRFHSSESIK